MRIKTLFAVLLYANISKEKFMGDHENKLAKKFRKNINPLTKIEISPESNS